MLTIVDNHSCNVGSVINILKKIGIESIATDKASDIAKADRLILPGVGAFDTAMKKLKELGIQNALNERVLEAKVPVLGICLGMHLLADESEEGQEKGLGWIPGQVKKLRLPAANKIPHMGWNSVANPKDSALLKDYVREPRFYFVHSYHYDCHEQYVLGRTQYGYEFTSVVSHENILGAQFHPEKSHKYGMKFLTHFMEHYK